MNDKNEKSVRNSDGRTARPGNTSEVNADERAANEAVRSFGNAESGGSHDYGDVDDISDLRTSDVEMYLDEDSTEEDEIIEDFSDIASQILHDKREVLIEAVMDLAKTNRNRECFRGKTESRIVSGKNTGADSTPLCDIRKLYALHNEAHRITIDSRLNSGVPDPEKKSSVPARSAGGMSELSAGIYSEDPRRKILAYINHLKSGNFMSEYLKGITTLSDAGSCCIGKEHADWKAEAGNQALHNLLDAGNSGTVRKGHLLYECFRELKSCSGRTENELEFLNLRFLNSYLCRAFESCARNSEENSEPLYCSFPLFGILVKNPKLVPVFIACPIPLSRICHLRSLNLLQQSNKALGYLYLLFNNLDCDNRLFRCSTSEMMKITDRIPNDNPLRYLGIHAMVTEGMNITLSVDFVNRDIPDIYLHYMIRNRRYHIAKYGLKKFVTRNSARRKENETLTSQATVHDIRCLSLFIAIYEMLTSRHGGDELILNDAAAVTAIRIYRQSLKFLGIKISARKFEDEVCRALAILKNTGAKEGIGASLNRDRIRSSICRVAETVHGEVTGTFIKKHDLCDMENECMRNFGKKLMIANEMLTELDERDAFEMFSEKLESADSATCEILRTLRKDSYADAVSAAGFSYKTFSNTTKMPYNMLHRNFTRDECRLLKQELFCQSRDKGRL